METGVLNPDHYPARRAARVVQHYLNTRYGSPYKVFHLDTVHSATAEVSWSLTLKRRPHLNVVLKIRANQIMFLFLLPERD